MILIDFSQTVRALVNADADAKSCASNPSPSNKKALKYMLLNSIRSQIFRFKEKYGKEVILACDDSSWRFDVFPEYKHSRRKEQEADKTTINWNFVFKDVVVELLTDIQLNFPMIVIKVPKCEGDDVIGVLTKYHLSKPLPESDCDDAFYVSEPEPVLIISSDRDDAQLHSKYVKQYSAIEKIFVELKCTPREHLLRKIVKGDSGDGIPSIKSDSRVFVDKIRQKPISEAYVQEFFASKNPIDVCMTESERENFKRNELLISFDKIPQEYVDKIVEVYLQNKDKKVSKMVLMNYLIKNGMTNLVDRISDFF